MPYSNPESKRAYMKAYLARPGVAEARKAKQKEWSIANHAHLLAREKTRQLTKRAQCLVSYARRRARAKGMAFDLDSHIPDIQARIDAGRCEMTGIAFTLNGGIRWDSPSLDRKNPSLGYTASNVRVIIHALNSAMGNWGEQRLIEIVDAMQSCRKSRRSSSKQPKEPSSN